MAADYIPTKDSVAVQWMRVFAAGIAADPLGYDVLPPDSAAITAAVGAFATAYVVASDPARRTVVTVLQKTEARAAATRIVRRFAVAIKANADIADTDKLAIGVRPVNLNRSPIPVPATSPALEVLGATSHQHHLYVCDSTNPTRRAKPRGAASLQLFVHVGDAPDADPERASFYRAFTTNRVTVDFDNEAGGKYATYFARWASRGGDVGPWSIAQSMRVAA